MVSGGNTKRQSRIPTALQSVFLASNRGNNVNKPPPDHSAQKVFYRNWFFQRQAGSKGRSFFGKKKNKNTVEAPQKEEVKRPTRPKLKESAATLSPQGFLDATIRKRGYSTRRFKTLQSAYYNKPTQLQIASHDAFLVKIVREGNLDKLKEIIDSGVSPNPCNQYGESLVHMACRRGDTVMLNILLDAGADLQISDDYGRTPLHDACWAATPCFDIVDIILKKDVRMLHLTDSRGALPLSYVRKDDWAQWSEYLESKKEIYWKPRDLAIDGEQRPPPLVQQGVNTRPLSDPAGALSLELSKMVSSGRLSGEEAKMLNTDDATCVESDSEDEDDSDFDSDYDSEEEDSDFDEDELHEMTGMIQGIKMNQAAQ